MPKGRWNAHTLAKSQVSRGQRQTTSFTSGKACFKLQMRFPEFTTKAPTKQLLYSKGQSPIVNFTQLTNNSYRWHQDVKPANILWTSNSSRQADETDIHLIQLGEAQFRTSSPPDKDWQLRDEYGTCTYGIFPMGFSSVTSTKHYSNRRLRTS